MIKLIRFPEEKTGPFWIVDETARGITPLHRIGDKAPPERLTQCLQAYADMVNALDKADTAFVCLNICDDLTPQARGAVKTAWAAVQAALIKNRPNGAYADAVKTPETAYSIVKRERQAFADCVAELKQWHSWALQTRQGYPGSDGAQTTEARIKAAEAVLNGKPR